MYVTTSTSFLHAHVLLVFKQQLGKNGNLNTLAEQKNWIGTLKLLKYSSLSPYTRAMCIVCKNHKRWKVPRIIIRCMQILLPHVTIGSHEIFLMDNFWHIFLHLFLSFFLNWKISLNVSPAVKHVRKNVALKYMNFCWFCCKLQLHKWGTIFCWSIFKNLFFPHWPKMTCHFFSRLTTRILQLTHYHHHDDVGGVVIEDNLRHCRML